MDICASNHGPALGLIVRSLRALLASVWRAVTLPYAGALESAVAILTFWLVLVFYSRTTIYTSDKAADESVKRAA